MKKFTLSIVSLFLIFFNTYSADFYWVGGSGNWSDFMSHWATSSGGSTFHADVPGTGDNVYFDSNSFLLAGDAVTVDVDATFNNMDWTGVTNTPDFAGWGQIYIYGSVTFDSNMTSSHSGTWYFKSANPGNTIDFSTVALSFSGVVFEGNGEWTFLSDFDLSMTFGGFQLNKGTVNTNGKTISVAWFDSWAPDNRVLNLSNSVLNIQNMNLWNANTLTINAGTSTINLATSWFDGLGKTFYDFNYVPTWSGEVFIQSSNTFHTLGLESNFVTGVTFTAGTITTVYDIKFGADCLNRKTIKSDTDGDAATIKKNTGTVQEDYLNIKDITIIGGASFITDYGVNLGNVTNWTINSSASTDFYWVGDAGNWSDPDHWSTTSGGTYPSGNSCVPTNADNVYFDANSFSIAAQTVTIDVVSFCNNIDWTGVTNSPTLTSNWPGELYVFGSLTFDASMSVSGSGSYHFTSSNTGNTVDFAGLTLSSSVYFDGAGEWTLQNEINTSNYIYLEKGSLITADQNLTCSTFYSSYYNTNTRQLTSGNSIINCTYWQINDGTNFTINPGNSVINISGSTFYGAGLDYYDLVINNSTSISVFGANTFNNISNPGGSDIYFESGLTNTFSSLTSSGDCSDLIHIESTINGDIATLSCASGTIDVNYVYIEDITATGGATFNANSSVEGGNVTNWNFTFLSSVDYYWIGGSGNWSDASHWSLSSGGAANAGGCIPTQVDNVFFDANSGLSGQTVTINQAASCNDMDWTGTLSNSNLSGSSTLSINGSLTFSSNMNLWLTGNIYFKSNNAGNTITSANKTFRGGVYFDGNGEWTLQDNIITLTSSYKSIYFLKGSLITNGNIITAYYFNSSSDDTRILNIDGSTINVTTWSVWNEASLTITSGTSTINQSSGSFYGGSQDYNDVNITYSGTVSFYGSNSFDDLNASNASNISFEGGSTQTFNTLSIPSGTSCNDYFNIGTLTQGEVASLSMPAGTFNGDWLLITDITAGGGGTFNATNSIGVGDVTGWTITSPAPVDLYWIGDGGDWSDPLHWSLSSGGPSYGCLPTTEDNVIFDENSFSTTGQIVNINLEAYCKNMDWTNATNTPELTGWSEIYINGSLTLISNMNISFFGAMIFNSDVAGNTITSAGQSIGSVSLTGGGEYSLQDDLNLTSWNGLTINKGTFNTNNFDITIAGGFQSNSSSTRTINLGSSTISVTDWLIEDNTNLTFNAGTSEIILGTDGWAFHGGNLTYNNLTVNPLNWNQTDFTGSNTFNNLTINPGSEIMFEAGSTQSTTNFFATGNNGDLIVLLSSTNGVQAEINQISSEFCGDFLDLKDMLATGNTFYAGTNSVDNGNNTGWTFSGVVANDQYPAGLCEDIPGGGTASGINLTTFENSIDAGNGYTHTWYEDAALTILVATPNNVTVSNGLIFYDEVDNGTCTNIAEVLFTVDPITSSAIIIDNLCNSESLGSINLTVNTGNAPFTFAWSNGAVTEDISGLTAGTYTITITDAVSCVLIENYVVSEPSAITIDSESAQNISCNGLTDGEVHVTASGGTGALDFDLGAGGQANGDFTGLAAANYTVTVTDINGCSINSSTFTITEPSAVTIDSESAQDISCNGLTDGEVHVTASGGTGALDFDLGAGGQANGDFTGLTATNYVVTVTDINGCSANSSTLTVSEPTGITIDSESSQDISCNGLTDGEVHVTASGGTGALDFDLGAGGQANGDFTGLAAANYTVTVTDINGCSINSSTFTITEPSAITIDSENVTDISCNGLTDGEVHVTASGGTGALDFDLGAGGQANGDFTGLAAANYTVTVTDINGCSINSSTFTIAAPSVITIDSESAQDISCNGLTDGEVHVTASGGTGVLDFDLGFGGQANGDFTGLTATDYVVTVTDDNGCTNNSSTLTVNEPSAITIDSESAQDISCNGLANGEVHVTASGGTGSLNFDLGAGGQANGDFTGLTATDYVVTVTDDNGCTNSSSTLTVNEPSAITIDSENVTDISCNGLTDGEINITASGGTASLNYIWDVLESGTSTFTGGSGVINEVTTNDYTLNVSGLGNLDGTTYSFTEICVNINHDPNQDLDIYLISPDATMVELASSLGGSDVDGYVSTCFNQSAATSIAIETPPFNGTFQPEAENLDNFNNGQSANGTWTLRIVETANPGTEGTLNSWSVAFDSTSYATSQTITNLAAGTYTVTITDASSCDLIQGYTILEPNAISIDTESSQDISCNGLTDGEVHVTASGGTGTLSFDLGAGSQINGDFTGLTATDYVVTVTDDNSCTNTSSTLTVNEPAVISIDSESTQDISCNGLTDGEVHVTASGGTGTLYFDLGTGNQITGDFTGLSATDYVVTVTDDNSCTNTSSTLTVNEPVAISLSFTTTNANCGNSDGDATVTAVNGTSPYTYAWDDGLSQTTVTATSLAAGTYNVTVTDIAGCNVSGSTIIGNNTSLTGTFLNIVNNVCFGECNGEATISASSGVGPYTFLWSNGQTDSTAVGLCSGNYTVTVTDAASCQFIDNVTITEPNILEISLSGTDVSCYGSNNGEIDATISGGVNPYTFAWSNGESSEDITGLIIGTYTLTVTDINSCVTIDSILINEPAQIYMTVADTICFGDSLFVGGAWQTSAGTYFDTHTAANLCDSIVETTLTINPEIIINLIATDTLCSNDGDIAVLDAENAGMTYNWSDGSTNQTLTVDASLLSVGSYTYSVTVTDGLCSETASKTIYVDICSSVNSITSNEVVINIYPNPNSTGIFNLTSTIDISNINVYDVSGRIIHQTSNKNIIDLSGYSSGMYFVKIETESAIYTKPIIISGNK